MRILLVLSFLIASIQSCTDESKGSSEHNMDTQHKHTNRLIEETSPYLLQHAHNPVDWYPWGEEALQKAQQEDKLILISVGYSACHWCHVMERESFEDTAVARVMNEHFVCIKVDREERPDVDQIYMNAVQLITQSGGWPLNCFALPDGRPVYGGTYFQKDRWVQILKNLAGDYKSNKEKFLEYADNLTEGVRGSDLIALNQEPAQFQNEKLEEMVAVWKREFDSVEGGPNRAPKFPIPNNYQFLLRYGVLAKDKEVIDHTLLTLDKMANGGIYDQIGGGFARYSTDVLWKVPHFEKMLYDNAQLLSLYSEAYQYQPKALYKHVVYQTVDFIKREMTAENGAFYSALDADSEGEEGKFYVWKEEELKQILGEDYDLVRRYYNVGKKGHWEHGNNILLKEDTDAEVAERLKMTTDEFSKKVSQVNEQLLKARSKRVRPGLDDKSLTSWNAMLIVGLLDAYQVFNEQEFLDMAVKNAKFLLKEQTTKDGKLLHSYKDGVSKLDGFLEDYCFVIEAYLKLYQSTFDPAWLDRSKDLMDIAIQDFYDPSRGMFYFTSKDAKGLIARKMELNDNVIPSSNSSIANALNDLGHYYDNKAYLNMAQTMLNNIQPHMKSYGSGYSNWGLLYLKQVFPYYEIAISGSDLKEKAKAFKSYYIPNKMLIGAENESQLPLMEGKYVEGETYIYVCVNKACQLPVTKVEEAVKQIK